MAKRDYSDFIEYASKHQNLPPTRIITEYRKQGGQVQKKNGLQLLREVFGYEKGEKRGKTVQQKFSEAKAKEYKYIPPTPKPKQPRKTTSKPKGKGKGIDQYFILNPSSTNKDMVEVLDRDNPIVTRLENNIKSLYGFKKNYDTYIQINVVIDDDGYTKKKFFSVMIPYKGNSKIKSTTISKGIHKHLNTYYSNLAKRYKDTGTTQLQDKMQGKLDLIKEDINSTNPLSIPEMKSIYKSYGIDIKKVKLLSFTGDVSEEEEEE